MRVSPFRVNAHQVSEKRDAAHNQAARGELCISATSGRSPIPPCSPSRLVALSRCPDAIYILTARALRENGTKVIREVIFAGSGERPFGVDRVLRTPESLHGLDCDCGFGGWSSLRQASSERPKA